MFAVPLLLAVLSPAFAAPPSPEAVLRGKLAAVRRAHVNEERKAIMGDAAALKDAVSAQAATPARPALPVCQTLSACREAPLSIHAEDPAQVDEAFIAAARPWLELQKARRRSVDVRVDPGTGVRLGLQGLAGQPAVTFEARPSGDTGFDVVLAEGERAAAAFRKARSAALARQNRAR